MAEVYDSATGMSFGGEEQEERGSIVSFYLHPFEMRAASQQAGTPIFEDRLYVKIIQPGNKNSIVDRAATVEDQQRWPVRYRQFQANQEQIGTGTPLEEWPLLKPSQIAMLKALGIHTVQALADVQDTHLNTIGMGARELRDKAIARLASAASDAPLAAALHRIKELEGDKESMMTTVAALKEQVEGLLARDN